MLLKVVGSIQPTDAGPNDQAVEMLLANHVAAVTALSPPVLVLLHLCVYLNSVYLVLPLMTNNGYL